MFTCQNCRKPSQPKEKKETVTIQKKEQTYYNYTIVYRKRETRFISSPDKYIVQPYIDKGWKVVKRSVSKGWEIAEEINVCKKCYLQLTRDKE